MARATLTISSKNYSSWSLRGWLLCRMAGLDFEEQRVGTRRSRHPAGTAAAVALGAGAAAHPWRRDGVGYAGDRRISRRDRARGRAAAGRMAVRAHCRAVSGEMHSGFYNLRSALPMNLKARHRSLQDLLGRAARCRAHQDDLDRMPGDLWRPVSVRCRADGGRRHVRAGLLALPHLCGRPGAGPGGLLRADLRLAADAGMDRRRHRRAGRDRSSSKSNFEAEASSSTTARTRRQALIGHSQTQTLPPVSLVISTDRQYKGGTVDEVVPTREKLLCEEVQAS